MKTKISIPLVILMYMLIYNPPIFGFNCVWVLAFPSLIYVFFNISYLKRVVFTSKVVNTVMIIIVIIIYVMVIAVLNANSIFIAGHYIYWIFGDIPFALSCWIYLCRRGQGFSGILAHVMAAGLLMALTAVMAMVFPPLKSFFTARMISYGIKYADLLSEYRNYGFAANMTSTTSMIQATLASIALYKGIKGKKIYYGFFVVLAVSALINTRSSILFLAAGLMATLIALLKGKRIAFFTRYIVIVILSGLVAIAGLNILKKVNPWTYEWINTGFHQITAFLSGERTGDGYFGALQEMTTNTLPKGLQFLFGAGIGVLGGSKYGVSSDVGFINDLWRGGILLFLTLLLLYFYMLKNIRRSRRLEKKDAIFLSWLWFFVFILDNIKGSFFIHSDLTVVFWILYTALVFGRDEFGDVIPGTAVI